MAQNLTSKIRLGVIRRLLNSRILGAVEAELFKTKGVSSRYILMPGPALREPEWNFEMLKELCDKSFIMEMITRTLTQEVARPGFDIKPRFASKCTKCLSEFQTKTEVCPECGSEDLREPALAERTILQEILRSPNKESDWDRMLRSMVEDDIKAGNWWLSITYQEFIDPDSKKIGKKVSEIFVEDPRYIRIMADEKARIRSDEYFCPKCYTTKADVFFKLDPRDIASGNIPTCPTCKGSLVMTAYVQQVGGTIKARWAIDEIVHGSSTQKLPELYGRPRPLTIWKWLLVLDAMLNYLGEAYGEGHLAGFLIFKGLEQNVVNALKASFEKELESKQVVDSVTGQPRVSLRFRQIWIGTGTSEKPIEPVWIAGLPNPKEMQSIEWFKFGIEKVTSVFGVTPVFVSIIESGKAGNNPRMQLDVQNRTIQELLKGILSPLNQQLLLRLGVQDWLIVPKEVELRDDLRIAQIEEIKARAAAQWLASGFDVKLDPTTKDLVITGEGRPAQEVEAPTARSAEPKISEESGAILGKQDLTRVLVVGTKGEVEQESKEHRLQSGLTIIAGGEALRLDAGAPITAIEQKLADADRLHLFLSHAHPDHSSQAYDFPGAIITGPDVFKALQKASSDLALSIEDRIKEYAPFRWHKLGAFRFKLYPTLHSKRAITPTYGLKVDTGRETFLYLSDFIGFKGAGTQADAFEDVNCIILDGSSLTRDIVRQDKETEEIYGHTSLLRQIRMAAKAGIKNAWITHLGEEGIESPAKVDSFLSQQSYRQDISLLKLTDGMIVTIEPPGRTQKAEDLPMRSAGRFEKLIFYTDEADQLRIIPEDESERMEYSGRISEGLRLTEGYARSATTFTAPERATLERSLRKYRSEDLRALRGIEDSSIDPEVHRRLFGSDPSTSQWGGGYYAPWNNRIYLAPRGEIPELGRAESIERTFHHEMGHHIAYSRTKSFVPAEFEKALKSREDWESQMRMFVTDYASKNPTEAYACGFQLMRKRPAWCARMTTRNDYLRGYFDSIRKTSGYKIMRIFPGRRPR